MRNNKKIKNSNITITVIFDGSALNRDEKIGGNILSIKKMTYHNEMRPFISKNAIRHYLFTTLSTAFGWDETPILLQGSGDKQTLQLDLTKSDILNSKELAVFGYMFTKPGEGALTRKSPLGITKAVGLSEYQQDIAFYANHDFVNRVTKQGKTANPNPVNKEEHSGLFKVSYTIDKKMLGEDTWIIDEYSYSNGSLHFKIALPQIFVFGNCEKEVDEDDKFIGYKIKKEEGDNDSFIIKVDGVKAELPKEIVKTVKESISFKPDFADDRKKNNKGKYETKYKFKVQEFEKVENDNYYAFECSYEPSYDEDKKTLTLKLGHEKKLDGFTCNNYNKSDKKNIFESNGHIIEITSLVDKNFEKGPFKVSFNLSNDKKNEIIEQIATAIHNGLIAHSSGESNTIVPLFLIAGKVKVPSPVFHSFIDVKRKNDGLFEVIGINDALKNSWLEDDVYIFDSERVKKQTINSSKNVTNNWEEFLNFINEKKEDDK